MSTIFPITDTAPGATEIARLRELLAAAAASTGSCCTPRARPFVTREDAALLDAARAALPALLDRLEAAEAVVEAARERCDDARPRRAPRLRAALRRYDEARRG